METGVGQYEDATPATNKLIGMLRQEKPPQFAARVNESEKPLDDLTVKQAMEEEN